MHTISASQIRAARGLLNWTQDHLADKSGVSRATLQSIENGQVVRASKIKAIQKAFEKHCIEFLQGDGVRWHPEGPKDFIGPDSCDQFFEDVLQTIKEKGGDLICVIDTKDMLTKISGTTRQNNLQRLEQIQKATDVKCLLLAENISSAFNLPKFSTRILSEELTMVPTSTFVYGNKLAIAFRDPKSLHFTFTVLPVGCYYVERSKNYFTARWQFAKQVLPSTKQEKICA